MSRVAVLAQIALSVQREKDMNPFRTAALLTLLVSMSALAHGQGAPAPSFTTSPSPPVAGQPFVIDANFAGAGGTPTFPFAYAYASGGQIAISGLPEFPLVYGHVRLTVPAMQAGHYDLTFTTVGFSPRPNYAGFQIVVAPQGAALSSAPTFSTAGISLCAFAILFLGIAALRRKGN